MPGASAIAVAKCRGAPARDGPGGFESINAKRRDKLVRGRYRATSAITINAPPHARDEHIEEWDGTHFTGRQKGFLRVTVDHCPQQRCDDEEHSENSENDRAVREEKYFDQYQNHSQNEERDDLPASKPGEIMAQEKECETNGRDN